MQQGADHMPVSYIGQTNHHRGFARFGIKPGDRLSHVYILGQTGVGKSTLLGQLARQDAGAGQGFALVDPHGDLVSALAADLRSAGVPFTYLNAADRAQPFGYNPLRRVRFDKVPLAASGLLETFKKLWPDAWGIRMEHILRNCLFTLLERDESELPDILRLFSDKIFRQKVVSRIENPVIKAFWKSEFAHYQPRFAAEALAPIQNKLGALLSDPMLYRILVTPERDIRFRSLMDAGEILLVNLAKGQVGSDSANTLGSLLVSTLGLAAMSRAESESGERRPFTLYVDEFQNFTTIAFASMMAEMRKFGLGLVLAHQHVSQLDAEVRHAVLGNAATLIAFRTGVEDASLMARELRPRFTELDLMNLPNRRFYIRLMIDGAPSQPFSGELIPSRYSRFLSTSAGSTASSRQSWTNSQTSMRRCRRSMRLMKD